MATLEKIRSKAALLVVVVGIALFAFIIGDFLRGGSTFLQQSKENILVVNGENVNYRDYQQKIEEYTEMSKRSTGSISEEQQHYIRETVYNEYVNSILLNKLSEKTGLGVSKEELSDIVLGNNISPAIQQMPDFINPQTGRFDRNLLIQFLQTIESDDLSAYPDEYKEQILSAKRYWLNIEKSLKENALSSKLRQILTNGINTNTLEARASFNNRENSVDISYVSQAYATIPDADVSVSNNEISSLYNERKESYKDLNYQTIDYIAVNITPSENDYAQVASDMEVVYRELEAAEENQVAHIVNDNSDVPYSDVFVSENSLSPTLRAFVTDANVGKTDKPHLLGTSYTVYKLVDKVVAPDSAFVYQVTLPAFTDETAEKQFADSLINVIRSSREAKDKAFQEMANSMSGNRTNGELGWQTERNLIAGGINTEFVNDVFNARVNEPFVTKSTFGSHVVLVTEKTKPVNKYKIAEVIVAVTPSNETINTKYNELNQYLAKNNNIKSFREAANEAGFMSLNDVPVYENQNSLANIQNSRQVVRWAFENKKGAVSDIFECQDYFIAAAITGTNRSGYRSLESVSEVLKRELINKKKGEKIVSDLKAKNLNSLEQYADAMNSTVKESKFVAFSTPYITGIGNEPMVNVIAQTTAINQLSAPFAGNSAAYVLTATNKNESQTPFDAEKEKQTLNATHASRIMRVVQSGALLQENATIEDNRIRFY